MKILIVSHEYPPVGGGGANACMHLARSYARLGHETDIITVWYDGLKEEETVSGYGKDIHITRLKAKRKNKEHCSFAEMLDFLLKSKGFADRAVKKAKNANAPYDICQIFFGIPSGPVGLILKKKYKLPYVIRFGGGDIPGFQDRFAGVYKLIAPAIKIIWKNADSLVANSVGLKELAEGFCDRYPILVFNNGVDTDMFTSPQGRTYEKESINLLFVSRLIERKGLQYVLPYLRKLEDETGKKISFTIVGDGPYRETLEQIAKESGTSDMIEFVGQKDKDELLPYYQSSDIFVFPSKKEGMPNVVLEAMACGLPVCMSSCQGSSELIDGNGMVAPLDLSVFSGYLKKMLSATPKELERMSEESRRRAVEIFSWKKTADSYLSLFESITGKG